MFADRACPALDWAAEQGIETALVPGGDDADARGDARVPSRPTSWSSPATCASLGPAVLAAFEGRILNVHPSLLPAFPGLHAVRDALAAGVAVTGVTVHLVDATLDGGPIVAQEAVPVLPGDDETTLLERLHAVEHRLLPAAVAGLLAGAVSAGPGARRAAFDPVAFDAHAPTPRRALLSVSDKTGLAALGAGLVARQLRAREHRGDRPGPARGRPPGHRRRRRHGLPRDARRPREDAPPARPRRPPRRPPARRPSRGARRRRDRPVRARRRQPVPVRRGRPQARPVVRRPRRGDRHRRAVDGPGGRQEPRLGRDRDLARPLRGRPGRPRRPRHDPARPALGAGGRGVRPHRRVRRPDRRGAAVPDARRRHRPAARAGAARRGGPVPAGADDLDGQGRDAALRREPPPAGRALPAHRPRAAGRRGAVRERRAAAAGQGAQLQQRPRRLGGGRAGAAAARARPSSSSSTPTRAARPSARRCSRPGTRRSPATRCRRSVASWR